MNKHLIWLAGFLLVMAGCSKDDDSTGDTGGKDVIGLSVKGVNFSGKNDTVVIKTEGTNWCFYRIKVGSTDVQIPEASRQAQLETLKFEQYCEWLTLRRDGNQIKMIVYPNTTGAKRTFDLYLQSGNYYDNIKGTQDTDNTAGWNDNIGLSKKSVSFTREGGSVTVTTKNRKGWWISIVDTDGTKVVPDDQEKKQIQEGKEFLKTYDWLTLHIISGKIELTARPNLTDKERSFKLYLQSDSYFDTLSGTQK